jgi:hypothetical protein
MSDQTAPISFETYAALKDAELASVQANIAAFRRTIDYLTAGVWDDVPEGLTPEQSHRIQRAAFAAMNADFDFAAASRCFQAARDRLVRATE